MPSSTFVHSALLCIAVSGFAGCASSNAPLVSSEDAQRFAAVFREGHGKPDARTLQHVYLDAGSRALQAFDRDAIGGAQRLADTVATRSAHYRTAIAACLTPEAQQSVQQEARDLVAAYRRLFPDFRAPQIHLLVGADTSSGMRLPGGSIALAVERICAQAGGRPHLRALLAHELAHVPQPELPDDDPARRDLLMWALREGAADYLGNLVRGKDPSGAGNAWAVAREDALFAQFMRDRATMRAHWRGAEPDALAIEAGSRWMWNTATPERPADLAYWIGQRIWHGYIANAADRDQALRDMLTLHDLDAILARSGYAPR